MEETQPAAETITKKQAAKEVIRAYDISDKIILLCLGGSLLGIILPLFLKNAQIVVLSIVLIFGLFLRQKITTEKQNLSKKYDLNKLPGII